MTKTKTKKKSQVGELKYGIHPDLPIHEYHHHSDGVSSSGIRTLLGSPRAFWREYEDPDRDRTFKQPSSRQEHILRGQVLHNLVLDEPRNHVAGPDTTRQSKAGKEAWAAVEAKYPDLYHVKPAVLDELEGVAKKLRAHPVWEFLVGALVDCSVETTYVWQSDLGIKCKSRPDLIPVSGQRIVDVKFTGDLARAERVGYDKGYYIQAAFHLDGVNRCLAKIVGKDWQPIRTYTLLFCEYAGDEPQIRAFDVSVEALDLGRIEYQAGLDTLYNCRKAGVWPALGERIDEEGDLVPYIATFNLPPWAETHDGRRYSDIVRGDRS